MSRELVEGSQLGILGWAARHHPATGVAAALPDSAAGAPLGGLGLPGGMDPLSLLAANADSLTNRVSGARGAAGYELLRRGFQRTPGLYSALVRRNQLQTEERYPGDPEARDSSMWDFVHDQFQLGSQRTLTYCALGVAHIADQCRTRRWELVDDAVARVLVAIEQAALDNSQWTMAWRLTFLREPQWNRIQRPSTPAQDVPGPQFGMLADPSWIATTIAYLRDAAAVQELRKKRSPKGKGKGKGKDEGGDG